MSEDSFEDNTRNRDINLQEFLALLNLSEHVNKMILSSDCSGFNILNRRLIPTNNFKQTYDVDFVRLAKNHLFNELYDVHRRCLTKANNSGNIHLNALKKKDQGSGVKNNRNGLHPKLSEKLDFVINEAILDSVLPFVFPVPIAVSNNSSNSNSNRNTNRESEKGTKETQNKKDSANIVINIPSHCNTDNTKINDKSANLASNLHENSAAEKQCDPKCLTSHIVEPTLVDAKASKKNLVRNAKTSTLTNGASDPKRGPEIVIHVCDEMKNTSRDFTCLQSLLVSKMGYFANVTAGQKLDDMDISVHCDIYIFDWLMRWVKQSANANNHHHHHQTTGVPIPQNSFDCGPQLDTTNVIPILISASFLQMEPLFTECLSFCHANLSEVVRGSTNLSCLNDSAIVRLAAMFTNTELEMIRDKKERVLPRLWIKLIQSLNEPEPEALRGHYYSLVGLFRCLKCQKFLTNTMKSHMNCIPNNIHLNRWGQVVSYHVRDPNWNINNYIMQLLKEVKSWRKVYWKLWGHCHFLYCGVCESYFPVYQASVD